MIYINKILVTKGTNRIEVSQAVNTYLLDNKLVLVNNEGETLSEKEINELFFDSISNQHLQAISTLTLLTDFKMELDLYIHKVQEFIDDKRDSGNLSIVSVGFIQLIESTTNFSVVSSFIQKDLIDEVTIKELTKKAFEQAELGNVEYILDLMEYELLPILHDLLNEIQEEL